MKMLFVVLIMTLASLPTSHCKLTETREDEAERNSE